MLKYGESEVTAVKVKYIALCGLFAALNCICAWIGFPLGDSVVTLQTFSVALCLLLLGGKWGSVSILVYLLLGAVGLPVFSGFRGGIGALFGVTGGYLWGFLLFGLIFWGICALFGRNRTVFALIFGMVGCYVCGTVWYAVAFTAGGGISAGAVFLKCVAPYLLPDALKLWLAQTLSQKLTPVINTPSRT